MSKIKERLAELQKLKQKGQKRSRTFVHEDQEDIFDEVDANEYQNIMKQRLVESNFVVNDNGQGYVDYGQEDFEELLEDPTDNTSKFKKSKQMTHDTPNLVSFIHKHNSDAPSKAFPREKKHSCQDVSFMQGILDSIIDKDNVDACSSVDKPAKYSDQELLDDVTLMVAADENRELAEFNGKSIPLEISEPLKSEPLKSSLDAVVESSDKILPNNVSDPPNSSLDAGRNEEKFSKNVSDPLESSLNAANYKNKSSPTLESLPSSEIGIESAVWNEVCNKLESVQKYSNSAHVNVFSGIKVPPEECLERDGSLNLFWFDFLELGSNLYLFGKVFNHKTAEFVSVFVKTGGLLRVLYFLPRKFLASDDKTGETPVSIANVYEEVGELFKKIGINYWKSKPCTRKYAFELDDVPIEAEYLKVLYSYTDQPLPQDLNGSSFSRVFGTNTTTFEQFVLCKKILGPTWLKVKNPDFSFQKASWCRLEVNVTNIDDIVLLDESREIDPPSLNIVSIAMRTNVDVKSNNQEIFLISCRNYNDYKLDDTTPPEKIPNSVFTIIRPLDKLFPVNFEAIVKEKNSIKCERSEIGLLNTFMTRIQQIDPDIIVGHRWEEFDYTILIARLRSFNIQNWHRIGRMKRSAWPKYSSARSQMYNEKQIQAGRLVCDIVNEFGRSLVKAQSWSLSELVQSQLETNRIEIDVEKSLKSWASSAKGLLNFASHCEVDTYYIAAIAFKTQALPLSRILTSIAGNSWAHTLSGTRSERNEYILLHEFTRNKYICPNKPSNIPKVPSSHEDEFDIETENKKTKYKGGLVFEPKKGLYDNYILVMDFNSLYPSIIQEYNICFTTVDRSKCSMEDVPELPQSKQVYGILPRLISTLVNRRKQVKSLIQDPKASELQKQQWNIKQQALKLTANSMYGCLGFSKSRFYARQLAILTTFKGREILLHTKELADSLSLEVIYGDTDSLMINTNTKDYEQAKQIGMNFKTSVNERYSLLEIDIDSIFRKLLLYAKKKYAAMMVCETSGQINPKIEIKGLDMKRREFCALSKEVSSFALKEILSENQTEFVIEKIHNYLYDLKEKLQEKKIPLHKFIIYNALGKKPEDYPNGKTLPHVQVALKRISRGETVRVNDVISYIITEKTLNEHVADRAYPPQDVSNPELNLKIDIEYYLKNQILPPLERLCSHIEGTDRARLANCLGVQSSHYKTERPLDFENYDKYEDRLSEEERFKQADPIMLTYRTKTFEFKGLDLTTLQSNGFVDPESNIIPLPTICIQIENIIRKYVQRYYNGIVACDDPSCGVRTKNIGVYGHRCPRKGCMGKVNYEYSQRALYSQLQFIEYMFDFEKWKTKAKTIEEKIIYESNRKAINSVQGIVRRHLANSGWKCVDMGDLFSSLNLL